MERRYHEPAFPGAPVAVPCRHCASMNVLDAGRLEIAAGRAWHRCDVCEEWFLVRWDDAVSLGVARPVDAIDHPVIEHPVIDQHD